jgi:hypothetical protein
MLAICDRCGFQYDLTQLRKEWTGLMVCHGAGTNNCWEHRHPQEFVRGVRDDQVIRPNMRPEPADTVVSVTVQDDEFLSILDETDQPVTD